jgi:hypothetical protein
MAGRYECAGNFDIDVCGVEKLDLFPHEIMAFVFYWCDASHPIRVNEATAPTSVNLVKLLR